MLSVLYTYVGNRCYLNAIKSLGFKLYVTAPNIAAIDVYEVYGGIITNH